MFRGLIISTSKQQPLVPMKTYVRALKVMVSLCHTSIAQTWRITRSRITLWVRASSEGYQLTDVYLDNNLRKTRCLSFYKNEYIRHCNHIIYDTTNKVYQCNTCNDKYLNIKVIIDGYEYQKCILNTGSHRLYLLHF